MSPALAYIVLGYVTLLGSHSSLDALPVTDTPMDPVRIVRDDYTYTPGIGAHKVHSRLATWNTARRTCEEEGGYLGIINSVDEANAVIELFNQSSASHVFVGLHDFYQEDEFVTIHGESVAQTGFNTWAPGEPNNRDNNEHCVILVADGTFNDMNCAFRDHFVCELHDVQSQVLRASR